MDQQGEEEDEVRDLESGGNSGSLHSKDDVDYAEN